MGITLSDAIAQAVSSKALGSILYEAYAREAMGEGIGYVQDLLAEIAAAERHNAISLFSLQSRLCAGYKLSHDDCCASGRTLSNVRDAIDMTKREYEETLPLYMAAANAAGEADVAALFRLMCDNAANNHHTLSQLYDSLSSNAVYHSEHPTKWKCKRCGFEHDEV